MDKAVLDKAVAEVDQLLAQAKKIQEENTVLKNQVGEIEKTKANLIAQGGGFPQIHTTNMNSVEQKALRNFGCTHPKQLLEVNTALPRFAHVPEEQKQAVRTLKESVDTSRWMQQLFEGAPLDRVSASEELITSNVKGSLENYYGKNELAPRLKAFGSTVVGGGDEWVPTAVSAQFIEEWELEKRVAGSFLNINMPSNPFHMPIQTSKQTARIATENTSFSDSSFTTDKLELQAIKFSEFSILPDELLADSAPNFMSLARADVVNAIKRAQETAILNGDSDGTHIDSDTQAGAANLAEKSWDGLRKIAIANSANGGTETAGAALSDAFLRQMRKNLGRFGGSPRDLIWFVSPIVYQQMLGLDDVTTVEKFGPQATILQGALAAYQGIPIVVSEFMRDDLNVSGVHDGVTEDNSGILLLNHRRHMNGIRRPIRMRVMQDLLDQDRMQVAALARLAFVSHAQSASEVSVCYGVDVTA